MAMKQNSFNIGVDLGATKTSIGIVNSSGHIEERLLIPTLSAEGPEAVIQQIYLAVEKLKKQARQNISAIGVGVAGQVAPHSGTVYFAPNLNWKDVPLQGKLQELCQLPCLVVNDVRAATVGEWLFGAGRGSSDLLCLFVGSGIGGGIVSGGKLIKGHTNCAGEFGHMTIDLHGPQCHCGNRGCLESLAGGWGMARRAREKIKADPAAHKLLLELVQGHVEELTAAHLFRAYALKEPLAVQLIEEAQEALVAGAASLLNAFNPERLILGGGVIDKNPALLDYIRNHVGQRALKTSLSQLKIVSTQLKGDAGMVGASALFALAVPC